MLNYTTSTLDSSHFSKWTPLTGMYIATATLVFAIAIIGDLVEGLSSKQYWIPSGYTSLNSISLTILGAATKLSMDLSTTMPRHIDQLAKLGTSAFLCIALASIHPSLGKLENSEPLSNTVSLSILVISSIASLCIQLRTGVIHTFKTAHFIMLTMMSLLLLHCILSAAFFSIVKCIFQNTYEEKNQSTRKEWTDVDDKKHPQTQKLKQYLKGFSMLAYSSCPHFQLSLSSHCTLTMIYGLVPAIAFFVTQITHGDEFLVSMSSNSDSSYDWSVLWILISQTIALGVGTIILCIRGCYIAVIYSKGKNTPKRSKSNQVLGFERGFYDFTVYLQHKSLVYKLIIFLSCLRSSCRILLAGANIGVLWFTENFWMCISDVCSWTTKKCITCKLPHSPKPTTRPEDLASEVEELSGQYISSIPLKESEGSAKWTMKSILYVTQKYMSAKERNTEHIEELLRQCISADFRGVFSFDNEEVAPLDASKGSPPNCWSLPVVMLTNIAITLPDVDYDSIVKLIKGVNEGFVLAKVIEDKFNNQPIFNSVSYAANRAWKFDLLREPAFQNKSPIEILESIATSAKNDFHKLASDFDYEDKVLALSKYRLCETLLVEYRNENEPTLQPSCETLFKKLRATIADILGACLVNLKYYILVECAACTSIEKRREAAASILTLFGDTEKIMEIIETREIPEMSMEEMVFIDNWREYYKRQSEP